MKKKIVIVILICVLGFYFIPSIVHEIYHSKTTDEEIVSNRELYNSSSQELNKDELDSLYLWFHVRGLPIDEGHKGVSKAEQWKEIISYWKQ